MKSHIYSAELNSQFCIFILHSIGLLKAYVHWLCNKHLMYLVAYRWRFVWKHKSAEMDLSTELIDGQTWHNLVITFLRVHTTVTIYHRNTCMMNGFFKNIVFYSSNFDTFHKSGVFLKIMIYLPSNKKCPIYARISSLFFHDTLSKIGKI